MQANKSGDTSIELILRRALFARGLRYRIHYADLPGKPDVVFTKARVAVFIDGDFWHGYRFQEWKHKLPAFWREKISINRARDRRIHSSLRRHGWTVIRIWEHQIRKDLMAAVDRIESEVRGRSDHMQGGDQSLQGSATRFRGR